MPRGRKPKAKPVDPMEVIRETNLWPEKLAQMNNEVNNPSHYIFDKFELIDFREEAALPFHLDAVLCYIIRFRKKDGLKDLKKAQWYLDRYIMLVEKENFRAAEKLKELAIKDRRNGTKTRRQSDFFNGVI